MDIARKWYWVSFVAWVVWATYHYTDSIYYDDGTDVPAYAWRAVRPWTGKERLEEWVPNRNRYAWVCAIGAFAFGFMLFFRHDLADRPEPYRLAWWVVIALYAHFGIRGALVHFEDSGDGQRFEAAREVLRKRRLHI